MPYPLVAFHRAFALLVLFSLSVASLWTLAMAARKMLMIWIWKKAREERINWLRASSFANLDYIIQAITYGFHFHPVLYRAQI